MRNNNCKTCENGKYDIEQNEYSCDNKAACEDIAARTYKNYSPRKVENKHSLADGTVCEMYNYLEKKINVLIQSQIEGPAAIAATTIARDYIKMACEKVRNSIINY